jgi:metal-dependent amidase/aminoacylase/carboxypeptidase family protein
MIDQQDMLAAIDRQTDTIRATMRFVHDHPELGHEELACSGYLCDTLAAAGLEVERGVGGMETAFRASLHGERAGATVGRVCLYDAVTAVRPDDRVTAAVADAFRALGRDFVSDPPRLPFATDFGNISRRCPAALIGVGREGGWSFHTDEGAAQFASPAGEEAAVTIAHVLALAAADLAEPDR